MSELTVKSLPVRPLKWLFVLSFMSFFWMLGSASTLPFPYEKAPFGIPIGMGASLIFVGVLFLIFGKAPRLIYTLMWSIVYFWIMGWFGFEWSEFHEATLYKNYTLALGFGLGVAALYWIYPSKSDSKGVGNVGC